MNDVESNLPTVSTFVRSKLGEVADSCEDRIAMQIHRNELRIALSDGATTSSFSAQWAERLTSWFVERRVRPTPLALLRVLPALGRLWLREVRSRPLPWHAEEKILEGSFATFLGLTYEPGTPLRAIVVGDSCLFHIRGDQLLDSFPYRSSEQFASRPVLLSTSVRANAVVRDEICSRDFDVKPGDVVLGATDGISQWLMRADEAQEPRWDIFTDSDKLQEIVDEERSERRMRNDDVACAWFTV